jgi:hypothetical protein
MNEITLQITVDEANLILEALGNLPFVRVYALIAKLQQQAREHLNAGGAAAAADEASPAAPTIDE